MFKDGWHLPASVADCLKTEGVGGVAQTRHLGLGVIESRWFDERHHTVRPLFEFLSYALKDRPDAFTYERFVGSVSFREAVRFMMSGGDVDYLYIAAHGDFGRIEAPDGSCLSRTFLRNTICEVNRRRRRLKGVLFGSCKFGDAENLIEILRPSKVRGDTVKNRLLWAAGYAREIDYTRSSLFDIYFSTYCSAPTVEVTRSPVWRRPSTGSTGRCPASSTACRSASWCGCRTVDTGTSPSRRCWSTDRRRTACLPRAILVSACIRTVRYGTDMTGGRELPEDAGG